eukprot:m.29386 g.29386  ORF g.29386 m.29386 type:complete len:60 (+) comp13708_c0_seq1:514-693(+)
MIYQTQHGCRQACDVISICSSVMVVLGTTPYQRTIGSPSTNTSLLPSCAQATTWDTDVN